MHLKKRTFFSLWLIYLVTLIYLSIAIHLKKIKFPQPLYIPLKKFHWLFFLSLVLIHWTTLHKYRLRWKLLCRWCCPCERKYNLGSWISLFSYFRSIHFLCFVTLDSNSFTSSIIMLSQGFLFLSSFWGQWYLAMLIANFSEVNEAFFMVCGIIQTLKLS